MIELLLQCNADPWEEMFSPRAQGQRWVWSLQISPHSHSVVDLQYSSLLHEALGFIGTTGHRDHKRPRPCGKLSAVYMARLLATLSVLNE